jgi:hypothetical protein
MRHLETVDVEQTKGFHFGKRTPPVSGIAEKFIFQKAI